MEVFLLEIPKWNPQIDSKRRSIVINYNTCI